MPQGNRLLSRSSLECHHFYIITLSFWWPRHRPEIIVATAVVYRMQVTPCQEVDILNSIMCGMLVFSQKFWMLVQGLLVSLVMVGLHIK